jgi:hypothetical protein
MAGAPQEPPTEASAWRLRLGATLFLLSIAGPVAGVALVSSLGLSGTATATASGAVLAVSEALGLLAVAVLGKPGYAYVKAQVGRVLRRLGPARQVGRGRYRAGLALIVVAVAFGWAAPYLGALSPTLRARAFELAIAGDTVLLVGLFVVGGEFWEKLRALFVYAAHAELH